MDPLQSQIDPVPLLCPSSKIELNLRSAGKEYPKFATALKNLLAIPFLDQIPLHSTQSKEDAKDARSSEDGSGYEEPVGYFEKSSMLGPRQQESGSLRNLLADLLEQFRLCAEAENKSAEALKNYGGTLQMMLQSEMPFSQIGPVLAVLATEQIKSAEHRAGFKDEEYEKFKAIQSSLTSTIADIEGELETLESDLDAKKPSGKGTTIFQKMKQLLYKLLKFTVSDDEVRLQIALLLGISLEDLEGDFEELYQSRKADKLAQFKKRITILHTQLRELRNGSRVLRDSMGPIVQSSQVLADIWTDFEVASQKLLCLPGSLASADQPKVVKSWTASGEAVEEFQKSVKQALLGGSVPLQWGGGNVSYSAPMLKALTTVAAVSPEYFSYSMPQQAALRTMSSNTFLLNTLVQRNFESSTSFFDGSLEEEIQDLKAKFEALVNPPDMTQGLEELNDRFKGLSSKFKTLETLPFIEALEIDNPFATPNSPDEPKKTNLQDFTRRYKEMYIRLQDEAIPVLNDLDNLADIQIMMIPTVDVDADIKNQPPKEGKISFASYSSMVLEVVRAAKKRTEEMSAKHKSFNYTWDSAMTNLEKAIKESELTANSLEQDYNNKVKELGDSHHQAWGILSMIGAFACFTAAVFTVPLGTVVFGSIGFGLLLTGAKQFEAKSDLERLVNVARNSWNMAKEHTEHLKGALQPMKEIKETVAFLASKWDNLHTIACAVESTMSLATITPVLLPLIKQLIESDAQIAWLAKWKEVKTIVKAYKDRIHGI